MRGHSRARRLCRRGEWKEEEEEEEEEEGAAGKEAVAGPTRDTALVSRGLQ